MQLLWKTVWQFLKKLKIKLLYDPEVPFLSIYWREWKICLHKTCTSLFLVALFLIAQKHKQPKCYYIIWNVVILFGSKHNEVLIHVATWINLENIRPMIFLWKEIVTKDLILYDSLYSWPLSNAGVRGAYFPPTFDSSQT